MLGLSCMQARIDQCVSCGHGLRRAFLSEKEKEERKLRRALEKAERQLAKHQQREGKELLKLAEKEARSIAKAATSRSASKSPSDDLQVRVRVIISVLC